MSEIKVSQLAPATALDGTELTHVVQGGTSKKATTAQYATYLYAKIGRKTLPVIAGSPCPVVITNFQTFYAGYDPNPQVRRDNGDGTYTYYVDATVTVTEVSGLPDSVSVNVANSGLGTVSDNLQIIFKT